MALDPVEKSVVVGLDPQAAFFLFTDKLESWWPVARHSVSASAKEVPQTVSMAAGVGGEIIEIGFDGTLHVWGKVTEWAPGEVVAFTWHPGRSADMQTDVRVTFAREGAGTRVTLVHSNWEILGDEAEAVRGNYDAGWVGVLAEYGEAA